MTSRISGDPVSHAHSYACVAADSPLQRLFPSLNLLRRTELFWMQSGVLWAVHFVSVILWFFIYWLWWKTPAWGPCSCSTLSDVYSLQSVQLQPYELSTLKLIADCFENCFINLSNFLMKTKWYQAVSHCLVLMVGVCGNSRLFSRSKDDLGGRSSSDLCWKYIILQWCGEKCLKTSGHAKRTRWAATVNRINQLIIALSTFLGIKGAF